MKHPNSNQPEQPGSSSERDTVQDPMRIFCVSSACEDGQNSSACARRQAEQKAIRLVGKHAGDDGSLDLDEQTPAIVPWFENKAPAKALLEWVLWDDALEDLIREDLVQQLRLAGEYVMEMADLDPGQREVLYVATVLWGLHMCMVKHLDKRHCCAGEELRDIARPALQVLTQLDPDGARLLIGLMSWDDQQVLAGCSELCSLLLEGLCMANLLPLQL